jgi:hypothetical protein
MRRPVDQNTRSVRYRSLRRLRQNGTYAPHETKGRAAHIAGYALLDVLITLERRITDSDPGDRGLRLDVGDPRQRIVYFSYSCR